MAAAAAAGKRNLDVTPVVCHNQGRVVPEGLQLGFAALEFKETRRGWHAKARYRSRLRWKQSGRPIAVRRSLGGECVRTKTGFRDPRSPLFDTLTWRFRTSGRLTGSDLMPVEDKLNLLDRCTG